MTLPSAADHSRQAKVKALPRTLDQRGASPNAFGIVMQDDSMAPHFIKGDVVTIDPNLPLKPDCNVLAVVNGVALVRKYRPRTARKSADLLPANKGFPACRIDARTIVGRCVGFFRADADA